MWGEEKFWGLGAEIWKGFSPQIFIYTDREKFFFKLGSWEIFLEGPGGFYRKGGLPNKEGFSLKSSFKKQGGLIGEGVLGQHTSFF